MKIEDMYKVRKRALQRLIDPHGNVAEFARVHDLDDNRVRHLLNGYRNFGEKAARQMEEELGLPDFYFDLDANQAAKLIPLFLHLSDRDQEEVERLIDVLKRGS